MATLEHIQELLAQRYPNEFSQEELRRLAQATYTIARARQAGHEFPFSLDGDPDDEEVHDVLQYLLSPEDVRRQRTQGGADQMA